MAFDPASATLEVPVPGAPAAQSFDPESGAPAGEGRAARSAFDPGSAAPVATAAHAFEPQGAIAQDELPKRTLMDFLREEAAAPAEASPLTPAAPSVEGRPLEQPLPANEREMIEQQAPPGEPDIAIGAQRATVPLFGKEGTFARGVSQTVSGLLEWGLNKPEEFVLTLTPLAPAVAARYAPGVAAAFVHDVKAAASGDKEAMGRAAAVAAAVGLPAAARKAARVAEDRALAEGKPAVAIASPTETADLLALPGREGEAAREAMAVGEKRALAEPSEAQPGPVAETLLPKASETFKEVAGTPERGAAQTTAAEGAAATTEAKNASKEQSTTEVGGDVLRVGETARQPETGMPVNEGSEGVRESEAEGAARAGGQAGQVAAAGESAAPGTADAAGGAPPAPPPSAGAGEAGTPEAVPQRVGIANAAVDRQRADRGLPPLMEPMRKADPALWAEAMRAIEAGPEMPSRLTTELLERPRPMTDVETVVMERELVRLTNDLDRARIEGIKAGEAEQAARDAARKATTRAEKEQWRLAEEEAGVKTAAAAEQAGRVSDALSRVEEAVGRQEHEGRGGAGTLMGRAFRARRLLMREDYSYAGLERAARAAKGFARLDAGELLMARQAAARFKELSKRLEERLKEQEKRVARAETERDLARMRAEAAKVEASAARKVARAADKVGAFLDARADAARARLRGKLLSLSPEDLKDIGEIAAANLYHLGTDFARWSARMIEEVGERVRPHLEALFTEAQRIVSEARGAGETEAKSAEARARGRKPSPEDAREAVRARTQARIKDYEERIAKGDFEPRTTRKPPVDTPEITQLRYRLDQLKKEWQEGLVELRMARRSAGEKVFGGAMESLNAMRAVLTSADLSAVLRQGLFIGLAHPLRAARSIGPMLKAFASPVKAFEVEREIAKRRNYALYRASKLYLAEHGASLSRMEEAYMSRLASKLPGVGPLVKASERAYATYLNKLRADSFDAMAATLGRRGRITPEQGRIIANYVNVATGRGTLSVADRAATDLNTFFFAPKFVASRFQMLAGQPLYFGVLSGKAPPFARGAAAARALVAAEYARILIGAAVVYGLGAAAGAEIETDSRSSDFGKLRFGNTRIDPMAGLLQVTVLVSRVASGKKKTMSGRIVPLREQGRRPLPYGSETLWDVLARFGRMKLAPAPGLVVDAVTGKDVTGARMTPASLLGKATVPMSLRDIYESMREQGAEGGVAAGTLSIFGASVQNFDATRRRHE